MFVCLSALDANVAYIRMRNGKMFKNVARDVWKIQSQPFVSYDHEIF